MGTKTLVLLIVSSIICIIDAKDVKEIVVEVPELGFIKGKKILDFSYYLRDYNTRFMRLRLFLNPYKMGVRIITTTMQHMILKPIAAPYT